jgi:hypothetical protein
LLRTTPLGRIETKHKSKTHFIFKDKTRQES